MKNTDPNPISDFMKEASVPLQHQEDLEPLVKEVENKRYILLGESTHGTAEFYLWRRAITKSIIENQEVSFIAVEGDWPDCYRINRYIKGYKDSGKSAKEVLNTFSRWPSWMWANVEMIEFIEWLKEYNKELQVEKKIGFYGMDIYSLWESMHTVVQFLERVDQKAAEHAKELYECFEPYGGDADRYAVATSYIPEECQQGALQVLQQLQKNLPQYPDDPEEKFNIHQNAFVASRAVEYYQSMLRGDKQSWNSRDRSMVDTLYRIEDFYGAAQTAIIWAHNTHIGDARFTDMREAEMWNIGELLREELGEEYVYAVGLSTYKGDTIAGKSWDSPMERMLIPGAKEGSWEEIFHHIDEENRLYLFPKTPQQNPFMTWKNQRAIGVVYNPVYERGNYVPTMIGARYDALIHIDTSHALHPLHMEETNQESFSSETYPFAL